MLKALYVPTGEARIVENIEALGSKTNKRYEMSQMKINYLFNKKGIRLRVTSPLK